MVRTNEKKLQRTKEITSNTISWEQKIYDLAYRLQISADCLSFEIGFIKSWKISPKQCHGMGKITTSLPQLCETKDFESPKLRGQLPPWENDIPYKHIECLLSPNCSSYVTLVVTGISCPAFVYYIRTNSWYTLITPTTAMHYPHLHKWTQEDCKLIDPHASNQRYMQFSNIIGFNGKFYALSLQGTIAVIEEVDSRMIVTDVSSSRAVPSVFSGNFTEYLFESNGEILLIFSICTKLNSVVDTVEIFRLRLPKLKWEKVESLGDRALFIGDNICLIVSAKEVKCKGNCVYFTNRGFDGWWVYDIATGITSPDSGRFDYCGHLFEKIKVALS